MDTATSLDLTILENFIAEQKQKLQHEKEKLMQPAEASNPTSILKSNPTVGTKLSPRTIFHGTSKDLDSETLLEENTKINSRSASAGRKQWPVARRSDNSPHSPRKNHNNLSGSYDQLKLSSGQEESDQGFFDQMGTSVQKKRNQMGKEMNSELQDFLNKQKNENPRLRRRTFGGGDVAANDIWVGFCILSA